MSTTESPTALEQAVRAALATVDDPEIHKPITDLGMVKGVEVSPDGHARIGVYLTVAGCPMRSTITARVTVSNASTLPSMKSALSPPCTWRSTNPGVR